MSHSPIAPSSAHIWGSPDGCTGSVRMSELYPEREDSVPSMEGEACHELGEMRVGGLPPGIMPDAASNGVPFTEEMDAAATMYAEDVLDVMALTGKHDGPLVGIERRVTASTIHPESYGTPDAFVFSPEYKKLYIWDLKYGHGVVEVFENRQLLNYAVGILETLAETVADFMGDLTICLRVVQPRASHPDGPIREWSFPASDLRRYAVELSRKAHIALSDKATTHSGPHCRYCPARHACGSAGRAAMNAIDVSGQPVPEGLGVEAMATELNMLRRAEKAIEYRRTGIEAQVEAAIRGGTSVPGYAMGTARGKTSWTVGASEVLSLGTMLGISLLKDPAPITPTQAKKAGVPAEVVSAYSEHISGSPKLVVDDGSKAKLIFGGK